MEIIYAIAVGLYLGCGYLTIKASRAYWWGEWEDKRTGWFFGLFLALYGPLGLGIVAFLTRGFKHLWRD